jgi:hypothetical protein
MAWSWRRASLGVHPHFEAQASWDLDLTLSFWQGRHDRRDRNYGFGIGQPPRSWP